MTNWLARWIDRWAGVAPITPTAAQAERYRREVEAARTGHPAACDCPACLHEARKRLGVPVR